MMTKYYWNLFILLFLFTNFGSTRGLIVFKQNDINGLCTNILIRTRTSKPFLGQQVLNTVNKNSGSTTRLKEKSNDDSRNNNVNALTKSSWYAAEAFGKVVGFIKKPNDSKQQGNTITLEIDTTVSPTTLDETIRRIQLDNDREYFLSGKVDKLIYDIDCTFADPFVSFNGRDRFVENLSNLGSVITKYSARPIQYKLQDTAAVSNQNNDETTAEVKSKFMVKLELNLPWRPVLAWPWGVRCVIDRSTNLVVLHEESVSYLYLVLPIDCVCYPIFVSLG
jgi:hypothetical protein